VLLYKRNSGIRTARGHVDGIVGRLTITHLDRSVADRPLSHCYPGTIAAARTRAGRIPNFRGQVSDSFATEAAEDAAGSAGLDLQRRLRAGDPLGAAPDTLICKSFRRLMEAALKVVIPGAKVATVGTSQCP
jgi:hypothetical protein